MAKGKLDKEDKERSKCYHPCHEEFDATGWSEPPYLYISNNEIFFSLYVLQQFALALPMAGEFQLT